MPPDDLPGEPEPAAEKMFVIPTIDGGQAVISEPVKTAISGGRRRALRERTSSEKELRRTIKNLIVFALCATLLGALAWWFIR